MESETRHLRLMVALAETGSLTRATERLHLTPSALSHQLRDLETRLGAKLFHRVGKRLVTTPAGERLVDSARRALALVSEAERGIKDEETAGRGVVRLCTECYTAYHWLPSVIKDYRARHPRVEVQIDPASTRAPVESLLSGRLDVAIMSTPVTDPRLSARPFLDDELLVVMAPGHPLASKRWIAPSDLSSETLLLYTSVADSSVFQRVFVPARVTPAVHVVPLTEAIIELVKAGLGVAVLARWAVTPAIASGALVGVPLTKHGLRRRWSAVTLRGAADRGFLADFIDMLAKHAGGVTDRLATGPAGPRGRRASRARRRQ